MDRLEIEDELVEKVNAELTKLDKKSRLGLKACAKMLGYMIIQGATLK